MLYRALVLFMLLLLPAVSAQNIQVNIYTNENDGSYYSYKDYTYRQNPPRQSLESNGLYVLLNSKVRYIHSPSKLKGAKQAARINYYNSMYD